MAKDLTAERYLLEEDIERVTEMAAERYDLLESQVAEPQPADD